MRAIAWLSAGARLHAFCSSLSRTVEARCADGRDGVTRRYKARGQRTRNEWEEHVANIRALAILSCVARVIPSSARAQPAPAADRPPSALLQLAESAKSVFDVAYASDWRTASEGMRAVNDAAAALPPELPKPDIVGHLVGARRPAQHVAPTRAELTEAERIEAFLARP
jgi:hypothetical protein